MPNALSFCTGIMLMLALPLQLGAQAIKLTANPAPEHGSFGFAVALDGDYAVVGAPLEEDGRGVVYVFLRDPVEGWTQQAFQVASTFMCSRLALKPR